MAYSHVMQGSDNVVRVNDIAYYPVSRPSDVGAVTCLSGYESRVPDVRFLHTYKTYGTDAMVVTIVPTNILERKNIDMNDITTRRAVHGSYKCQEIDQRSARLTQIEHTQNQHPKIA